MVQCVKRGVSSPNENIEALIDAYDEIKFLLKNKKVNNLNARKYRTCIIAVQSCEEGFELSMIKEASSSSSSRRLDHKFYHDSNTEILVIHSDNWDDNFGHEEKIKLNQSHSSEISWSDAGNIVSECILSGVNFLKDRIDLRIVNISNEIENTGEAMKENIEAVRDDSPKDSRNELVMLTYSGGIKKASQELRKNTERVTIGVRDVVTDKIIEIADTIEGAQIGEKIVPNKQNREILGAIGNVASTGLGAAAMTFEVMFDTTETVFLKSNEVAADVVSHKYGSAAGKVVEDTSNSVYNTFRAVKLYALLRPEIMTAAVVKNTGKRRCQTIDNYPG